MLHKPSFVEEEEGCDLEVVWLNQRFNHPSLNLIHPALQCVVPFEFVQHVGGDLEQWLLSLIVLPHTYSCTYFIHQKVETNKDSTGFEHRGVYTLFNEKTKVLEAPNFIFIFLLLLFFIYIFLYSWDGKVDMMGNLAGWRHE